MIFIDDYEYTTPEDFVDNMPDVNYYPESGFDPDNFEMEY